MYTIEKRSYGLQVTVDSALEPHEIESLARDLQRTMGFLKRPYEPLGIVVRPSLSAQGKVKPRVYVVE